MIIPMILVVLGFVVALYIVDDLLNKYNQDED